MATHVYDSIGLGYAKYRRPDPRIAVAIRGAIGNVETVINVGAGTGSYEPDDLPVVAVEPSWEMCSQRPSRRAEVIRATAEQLPFRDASFDAALAVLTMHHWRNRGAGLREMLRVARKRVVLLTWDPSHPGFWLVRDYMPEILWTDRELFPSTDELRDHLGTIEIRTVAIPHDCVDGFLGAYWRRPEAYLDADVRRAISTFSRVDATAAVARLRSDLDDGTWTRTNGNLVSLQELDLGYRLVIATTGSGP
ncbi:MAG: class I SAM-dependent methyltransferase [Polyangia bacterium]